MTTTNLTKREKQKSEFEQICETLYKVTHEKFFRAALMQLVAYKVFVGRTITASHLYGTYGEGFIKDISKETGISTTVLYDACVMYQKEKLSPKTENNFVKKFPDNFASWNEYRQKELSTGGKSLPAPAKKESCAHCPLHCE